MEKTSKKERQERLRRNEEKWTPNLMAAGWTVIPSVILERQQALALDAIDINILLQLARHWWFSDNPPHPSKRTIAKCMGIDISTVRRRIARMERDGLLLRNSRFHERYGQQPNEYLFNGLIESATPFALEAIEIRKSRLQEDQKRLTSKRPQLQVIKGGSLKGLKCGDTE